MKGTLRLMTAASLILAASAAAQTPAKRPAGIVATTTRLAFHGVRLDSTQRLALQRVRAGHKEAFSTLAQSRMQIGARVKAARANHDTAAARAAMKASRDTRRAQAMEIGKMLREARPILRAGQAKRFAENRPIVRAQLFRYVRHGRG